MLACMYKLYRKGCAHILNMYRPCIVNIIHMERCMKVYWNCIEHVSDMWWPCNVYVKCKYCRFIDFGNQHIYITRLVLCFVCDTSFIAAIRCACDKIVFGSCSTNILARSANSARIVAFGAHFQSNSRALCKSFSTSREPRYCIHASKMSVYVSRPTSQLRRSRVLDRVKGCTAGFGAGFARLKASHGGKGILQATSGGSKPSFKRARTSKKCSDI